jgi:hypothetical protein
VHWADLFLFRLHAAVLRLLVAFLSAAATAHEFENHGICGIDTLDLYFRGDDVSRPG